MIESDAPFHLSAEDWLARLREEIVIEILGNDVARVELLGGRSGREAPGESDALRRARREVLEYLEGRRKVFGCPVDLSSVPPFTREILRKTQKIPYGETRSYAWVAAEAGNPRAARAAGQALHRNPVPLFVPCHRVVASGGGLGGFGSGISLKAALLAHEQRHKD